MPDPLERSEPPKAVATIVVFEGDAAILGLPSDLLAEDGYRMLRATDGVVAGRARAERHSPSAILLTLTPTSGSDSLARLEQNRTICHIPVVERPARALAGATGCRWMGSSAPSDLSELSDRLEDDAAR